MLLESRERIMYASHFQFYIEDKDNKGDTGSPDFWNEKNVKDRLAVVPGTIGISPASYGNVLVKMEHHDSEPKLDLNDYDHAIEASLIVSKGGLQMVGCLDEENAEIFNVEPSTYRIRCLYANLAEGEEYGEGKDWYKVQFWKAELAKPIILKFWSLEP